MHARSRQARQPGGFSLIETIFVIALLALASVTIARMQPRIFSAQNTARDAYVGQELLQACAERLLTTRRRVGLGAVTNTLCAGLGGQGGFVASPTVTLRDAGNNVVVTCPLSLCTATITIGKSAATASISALTVRMSVY